MKFVTLLPTTYNDGRKVPAEVTAGILAKCYALFGAYTKEGPVEGAWPSEQTGERMLDKSIRLTVACERDRYPQAVEFVLEAGRELQQEAMYFEVQYFDGVQILKVPQAS